MSVIKLFEQIGRRAENIGKDLRRFSVLDVFAGNGDGVLKYYLPMVSQVHAWEIEHLKCDELHEFMTGRNRPFCWNSFEQIKPGSEARRYKPHGGYDLIVLDNYSVSTNGKVRYWEHFDLFPHIFDWLANPGYLVILIFTDPEWYLKNLRKPRPEQLPAWTKAREDFYGEHKYAGKYIIEAKSRGFRPEWAYGQQRSHGVRWLVLEFHRG